jgi:tRNA A58 N-methylase Trm61
VLDVGCGTGYLCAIFAKLVGPQGVVVGSDRIPSCVDFGTGVLAQLGLSDTVRLFTSSTTGSEDAERPASNEVGRLIVCVRAAHVCMYVCMYVCKYVCV